MATVATAYVQVMPSMEGATENITSAITPQLTSAGNNMGETLGAGIGSKLGTVLKKLAPVAIVGAVGKELLDIGTEFDKMTDTIIVGTGASGEALESLANSAKSIATTVPTSFAEAGDIVQNLNTRLGLTGDALEQVGSRAIEAGNLLGESVDLDKLTGTMNQFGVSADEMAGKMDYLFNVGQATGIGFNDLTGAMEKNAPVLKQLGFGFEQSANMAGLLDKAGLDASSTMGKLSKVLKESVDAGVPAQEAYAGIITQIQEYLAVGDEVAALDLANEVFGVKGSAQFLDAVKSGTLSLDAMKDAALGAGDGIMGTMEKTEDWPQKFERLKNRAKEALEPLGGKLMDGINTAFDKLEGFLDENSAAFESLGSIVSVLADILGGVLSGALELVGGLFTALTPVIDLVAGAVKILGDGFKWLGDNIITPIMSAMDASIGSWAKDTMSMFQQIGSTISSWGDGVKSVFDSVTGWIRDRFDDAVNFLADIPNKIIGFFSGLGSMITNAIGSIHFPLPHISFENISVGPLSIPLPHVEWYAKGGMVDTPTLFGAGEAGAEAVVPLTQPALQPFADAVTEGMGMSEMVTILKQIRDKDSAIYLDGKTLVGGISSRMDNALGNRRAMSARGLA